MSVDQKSILNFIASIGPHTQDKPKPSKIIQNPDSTDMCIYTFKIFKDVLVKVGIPRNCIFLAAKIIVSKSETPLCCELSLSVLKDILIPRWVLTVLLRISLNIFHQTEQLMAVYLKYYVS